MTARELQSLAISHKATIDAAIKDVADNKREITRLDGEFQRLKKTTGDTRTAYSYLDTIIKEESGRFIDRIHGILNFGIKAIFSDCDYSIDIVTVENRITIHLVYQDENGNVVRPEIHDCGGGIRTVVGMLLQVFMIFHYHVEPLILIDEGISQVSSQYLPNLFTLFEELCEKNGLKIILITHDPRFTQYATRVYEVNNGESKLVFDKSKADSGPDEAFSEGVEDL